MKRVRAFTLVFVTASLALGSLHVDASEVQDDKSVSQKTIKDQAEYSAYMAASNEGDPAKRAALMEAFVQQYPDSIVKIDALEQAMAAYQKANNVAKVEDSAKHILQVMPKNIQAMAIVVALDRNKKDQAALTEGCAYSQTGLQQLPGWGKPEGMTDSEFVDLRKQVTDVFSGFSGYCAFQANNYSAARDALTKAVQLDSSNLLDVYYLGRADLEMNPIDLNGFWYCVKAVNMEQALNNAEAVKSLAAFCKSKYRRYHGGEDGWDAFVASVASQTAPPPADALAKAIPKAPTPCEQAVNVVRDNKLEKLPFADYEFILQHRDCSPANKEAADQVWAYIQGLQKNGEARIKMPNVKVIAANKDSMDAALTEDNQTNGKADLHVVFEKPVLKPPAKDAVTDITGLFKDYTSDPFMFTMERGELPVVKRPAKKPAAKSKPAIASAANKRKSP